MWWWFPAFGQDAPAVPADEPEMEEVVVWGEGVARAREAVQAQILGLGYTRVKARDGRVVFRNEDAWKGKVVLGDEGTLQVRRTGLRAREVPPMAGTQIRPYALCIVVPTYCFEAGSSRLFVSERRWRGIEDDVADATAGALVQLNDAMADGATTSTVNALPDRLEALWSEGTPVQAGPPLTTAELRRAALFVYWDTRTENEWGAQVRQVVEDFVVGRVQQSDDPFTVEEMVLYQMNRRSAAEFPFPLRPPG